MWWERWFRLWYRRRVQGTALAACWDAALPSARLHWRSAPYLVCDAEMSSLDLARGELLSVGWVPIEEGEIVLARAAHHLVRASGSVGESAGIHLLRDCDLTDAESEQSVLVRFIEAARGRILVFHHAPLDLAYLGRASRRYFGAPLLLPYIDTLVLERRRLEREGGPPGVGSLNLSRCRRRHGLPDYPVHNALVDALATGELLLAMMSKASNPRGLQGSGQSSGPRLAELL